MLTHRLPPADRPPRLAADPIPEDVARRSEHIATTRPASRLRDPGLVEKIALATLVTAIFAEVLPGKQVGVLAITAVVAFLIVVNTALSTWLARGGRAWRSTGREFVGLAVVNTSLILLFSLLQPGREGSINPWQAVFFGLLLT